MLQTNGVHQTLEEVVRRLKVKVIPRSPYSVDLIMSGTERASLRDTCVESIAKLDGEPDDISKLFATIDLLLEYNGCRRPVGEIEAPRMDYLSGVSQYAFYDHILEVSILKEHVDGIGKYYYVVISFPEQAHLYDIFEVPNEWVPQFIATAEAKRNDEEHIRLILISMGTVFDTFCRQFVVQKKFRRREFSMAAIEPLFSKPSTSATNPKSKKATNPKRKKTTQTTCDIDKFQIKINPVHHRLETIFKTMKEKPNKSARLFALIHDLLVSLFSCKMTTEKNSWPGGAAYEGRAYDLFYTETKLDQSVSKEKQYVEWHAFKISVLSNENEFYICIRFSVDTSKKCIKRIAESLVPTFPAADIKKENEKIFNLVSWLTAIDKHFLSKVIAGSYHSANPSFLSSVHDSESE